MKCNLTLNQENQEPIQPKLKPTKNQPNTKPNKRNQTNEMYLTICRAKSEVMFIQTYRTSATRISEVCVCVDLGVYFCEKNNDGEVEDEVED